MPEDLVGHFKQNIQRGASISHGVANALKKIQEEEGRDLSEVIQHIEIAEANFYAALSKIEFYEVDAINRVEEKYKEMRDIPDNNPENFIIRLWRYLIS
jgi:hypothetical protein